MRRLAAVGAFVLSLGLLRASLVARVPSASTGVHVTAVDTVGMTVADMDRAVAFYTSVLTFEKVSDVEVSGREYELMTGVFGARLRIVRLRLGEESIELTEFLAPKGRPIPSDARPNDRVFQHIAIIVSDMTAAYQRLRQHQVEHASTGPQILPDWNPNAAGIGAFYFRDPDRHSRGPALSARKRPRQVAAYRPAVLARVAECRRAAAGGADPAQSRTAARRRWPRPAHCGEMNRRDTPTRRRARQRAFLRLPNRELFGIRRQ